jgi:hypothetical protein
MSAERDLYVCDLSGVTFENVVSFVETAIDSHLQAESRILEFKSKRDGSGIAAAVAGMANSDGGLILIGVAEQAEDPIVGVPVKEVDAIVQSLRGHQLHRAAEIQPVAITPQNGRVVVIVRVDPDRFDTPVVLSDGRVVIRVPGHTVGASRDQIRSLYERPLEAAVDGPAAITDVSGITMWPDEFAPAIDARVLVSTHLPRRASDRKWLGTEASDASIELLNNLRIPALLLASHARDHEVGHVGWTLTETSALRYRLRADHRPSPYPSAPSVDASILVTLSGRRLQVASAVAVSPRDDTDPALENGLADLSELVRGTATLACSTCLAVASAMGFVAPLTTSTIAGSFGGTLGLGGVAMTSRWPTIGALTAGAPSKFAAASAAGLGDDSVDGAIRDWLTRLLLDRGFTGFETDLAALPLPRWAERTSARSN